MKRFGLVFLMIVIFLLSGCNIKSSNNEDNKKINVVTTIFPQYDFTRQIAKDKVNLKMLIPPGAESHSYEPTPQDIIDFVYVDPAKYDAVKEECDIFSGKFIPNISFRDFIYKLGAYK